MSVPSALQLPAHHVSTELGFFQCLLIEQTVAAIANHTTSYAHSKGWPGTWQTSAEELWLFIAVHIYMGIAHLPRTHMYWEDSWRQMFVVNAFSQHRFTDLLRFFHVTPPTPAGTRHTVIDKVSTLLTACQQSFSSCYLPTQTLAVDEAMVGFKGRDSMKQYLKSKPTRWGYKVWCLACDGYLLNFSVYKGKQLRNSDNVSLHDTVVNLVQPYANRGHILYLDNLFPSPALFDHLQRIGIRACGTLRPNRKSLPPDLQQTSKQLPKGGRATWQRGDLGCLAWNDKRLVYFLSNHTDIDATVSFDQARSDGTEVTVIKPKVVHDYNLHRGKVDTVDQLRGNYALGRKSMKNWPCLAWWLIDMCIVNAYHLFTLHTHSTATQIEFRIALMHQLAGAYPPQRDHEQQAGPPRRGRPSHPHYPKRSEQKRDCAYCSGGRHHRVKSRVVCDHCHTHLCLDPCFKLYHEAL
jgi:Transposase IS4